MSLHSARAEFIWRYGIRSVDLSRALRQKEKPDSSPAGASERPAPITRLKSRSLVPKVPHLPPPKKRPLLAYSNLAGTGYLLPTERLPLMSTPLRPSKAFVCAIIESTTPVTSLNSAIVVHPGLRIVSRNSLKSWSLASLVKCWPNSFTFVSICPTSCCSCGCIVSLFYV